MQRKFIIISGDRLLIKNENAESYSTDRGEYFKADDELIVEYESESENVTRILEAYGVSDQRLKYRSYSNLNIPPYHSNFPYWVFLSFISVSNH
jgi:hypothetical protein